MRSGIKIGRPKKEKRKKMNNITTTVSNNGITPSQFNSYTGAQSYQQRKIWTVKPSISEPETSIDLEDEEQGPSNPQTKQ